MYLPAKFWSALAYVGSFVTTSPFHEDVQQKPLPSNTITTTGEDSRPGFPNFPPPGGSHAPDEPEFNCTYPEMKGWIFCSTPEDRECWLRHPNGSRFDIHTDYETKKPIGEDRYYDLTITDGQFNADGIMANYTKLVNRQYPGPWIQACWGDVRFFHYCKPSTADDCSRESISGLKINSIITELPFIGMALEC